MAATLTLLKLPILPNKPQLPRPSITKLVPFPSIHSNSNLSSPKTHNSSFLDQSIEPLKPVFLSLTAFTFPLFLDSKASMHFAGFDFELVLLFGSHKAVIGTGCTCCGRRVWDTGRKIICSRTPHCDGCFFLLYIVGRVFGVAMAASKDYPERYQ